MHLARKFIGERLMFIKDESERYAKIKTLTVSLEVLKGIRAMALIYFYIILFSIVLTASIFSGLVYALTSYGHTGQIPVDVFVGVTGGVAVISLSMLIWVSREKRVLRALHVQEKLEQILTQCIH